MTRAVATALLLIFALAPAVGRGAMKPLPPVNPSSIDDFLDKPVVDIVVDGPHWAQDLERNLPIRPGMWLTRDRLVRALRHFHQNRGGPVAEVRVVAEPAVVQAKSPLPGKGPTEKRGTRLIFRVEPILFIQRVTFDRVWPLDNSTLLRAAALPAGTEMWPETVDRAAARIASEYARAGWREAVVQWKATPGPQGVDLLFTVDRGERTTLLRIELTGNLGLNASDLLTAFDIAPGARLSMDAIDEGIVEIKERYRALGFYRANVGLPRIDAEDNHGRAVVTINIDCGPKFHIQVRGNRVLDDTTILSFLHFTGEEVLDEPTQKDLARKVKQLYELAGYPFASVEVRESPAPPRPAPPPPLLPLQTPSLALPPMPLPPPPLPTAELPVSRYVTFMIHEGQDIRVVERRFFGDFLIKEKADDPPKAREPRFNNDPLAREAMKELGRRVELALEDTVPKDLVNSLDDALLRAANLGGAPGASIMTHPRVQPHQVFSTDAYKKACDEIASVYQAAGYLDVRVGPAKLETIEGNRGRVVIHIKAGDQYVFAGVRVDGVKEMPEQDVSAIISSDKNIHFGYPLSYLRIDETRKAILNLYQSRGYLSATVEDREEAKPSDPTQFIVTFIVQEGPQVRVRNIEVKGATNTPEFLVRNALTLKPGDLITPLRRHESVKNIMNLGIFTSASVSPVDITKPDTNLSVVVQERPGYSLDVTGGLSLVDGPRAAASFLAAHFLGTTMTFTAGLKVNVPIFRICSFHVRSCTPAEELAQTAPEDPVEWRASVGLVLPVFGGRDGPPLEQHIDLIAQNMLRPAYYLTKYGVLGTMNGLPHGTLGGMDFNTVVQLEVEADDFTQQNGSASSAADQQTFKLPPGPTQLVSLRPTFTLDGRGPYNDKERRRPLNPTSGGQLSLTLDFAHDFNLGTLQGKGKKPTPVSLISALLAGGGYIPIYPPRRVNLSLFGRVGTIFSQYDVIGTKVFFLGGTNTLRGFAEDGVVPQDVREDIRTSLQRCGQLVSAIGCTAIAAGAKGSASQGGTMVLAGRSDLRFALTESLDGDVFFDAGNLWAQASRFDPTKLRYSAGFGVSYPSPIGPAAIDLAFNLAPDTNVGESVAQVHFAIGL